MGKGFGSMMLKKFLQEIVFTDPGVNMCIVGPEPSNKRAINSYKKVGFKYVKTVQIPNEPEDTYIMELPRNKILVDI